ncbi:PAS domain S-box protein [Clostridium sp. chh4-2]|uniref:PrpR N-terminal domain-containing protein n=1 Tax=Clostridium sp. chh4-2 TaxID=2067550 RepID=UPI000CCF0E94|nr:PrpR N-terminal domain-containing protein [Clostridium sp. chh4-2]PNV59578.1 PAS domain S-box protein [Clostridium sp. chh4-2]
MGKIALMVSREEMLYQAHNILQEKKYEISEIRVVQTRDTIVEARQSIANGASIIIARGLQASLIKQYTDIPVVEIALTAQEMALLVVKAKQIVKKPKPVIAVVGFKNMFCDMSYFDTLYDIELRTYYSANSSGLRDAALRAVEEKADLIIGGDTVVEVATEAHIPSLFLSTTEDSLKTAFAMAESMNYAMGVEKKNAAQMETLLDYSYSGVIKLDAEGLITAVNPLMEDILGCKEEELTGKRITDVFGDLGEDAVYQVLSEGEEYSSFMDANRTSLFGVLAPILIENRVDGAILTCHKMKRRQSVEVESQKKRRSKGLVALGKFQDILQKSKAMQECVHTAKLYSLSEKPVMIIGEPGSETRLIAQSIHNSSLRNDGPFMDISCCGLTAESQMELIFADKGAAVQVKGGSLFIEDVDQLTMDNQYRLYQLIRYKRRSGKDASQPVHSDVRVMVSTGTSLECMMSRGEFRKDLYYLLNGLVVSVPPIRSREEDLRQKITDCIKEGCERYSRYHVLTNGAWKILMDYEWKGNLLQIESFCERLILTSSRRSIDEIAVNRLLRELYPEHEDFCQEDSSPPEKRFREELQFPSESQNYTTISESREAQKIINALKKAGGDRLKAAAELGISKTTLWRWMKKFEITEV